MYVSVCTIFLVTEIYLVTAQNSKHQKHANEIVSLPSMDISSNRVQHMENITYNIDNNNSKINIRVRKPMKKRRSKNRKHINKNEISTFPNLINSAAGNSESTTKPSKKKRRRRRRKKKIKIDNLLQVTTARPISRTSFDIRENKTVEDAMKEFNNFSHHDVISNKNVEFFNNAAITAKKQNRCAINNGGCFQICKPKGKIKCSCLKGYALAKNRKKCVDVNECRIRNGDCKELCRNTLGAYYCDCSVGFRLADDLRSCQDINECHLRNGHGPCQDSCTNTHGSYFCDCSHLNGTRLGKNKHSCEIIDHCEASNPGCSDLCISTRMGGFCSCPQGLELMSDYKTCQDIDECEDPSIRSHCLRGCVNTIGSYYCEEDFQNDQNVSKVKVPSCPPLDPPRYGFISCLRNKSLPFDTFSRSGRKIVKNSPGTKCQLECPVGFRLLGEGRFLCGITGEWTENKKGLCIRASYPKLVCPSDQTLYLRKEDTHVFVRIDPPQTNVRWKYVHSYPEWAKNLIGQLTEGHHSIQFSVTDPASRLSSICSFSIVVNKHV